MADPNRSPEVERRRLDATGSREVIFCHQCENEWYREDHGLICPRCEGEITEIVTPESDPRPLPFEQPTTPPEFHALRSHQPWARPGDDSDPEEADIEEHITHGPNGSVIFSQTVRRSTPMGNQRRRAPMPDEGRDHPDHVMRDFQDMIGNLMGPQFHHGQAGRSGPDTLFTSGAFPPLHSGGDHGPRIVGGRFTFSTTGGNMRPRDAGGPPPNGTPDLATYDPQFSQRRNGHSLIIINMRAPPDHVSRIIGGLFGPGPIGVGEGGEHGNIHQGMPPALQGLQGLFAAMLNPANARSGDAVYSQEALDQIISTLMEQHPTSNAPGPATAESIAALPKKKLDENMLGPEHKGECSVCMDDVHIGDEVVILPCNHWFHETCVGAWLSEHNTCPICRKGIGSETPPPNSRRSSHSGQTSRNEHRVRRLSSATRPRFTRDLSSNDRNAARLDYIRNSSGRAPPSLQQLQMNPRRYHVAGHNHFNVSTPQSQDQHESVMPGSFTSTRRPSELSENQRDSRRGNTSSSDRSQDSRRTSQSESTSGRGGAFSWIRDRFTGGSSRRQD